VHPRAEESQAGFPSALGGEATALSIDPSKREKPSLLRRATAALRYALWGHLFQRRRERIEERSWRRNLVLAGRKMQQAQLALTEDIEDVRGLKAHLDRAVPGLAKLESQLARAEALMGGVEERLGAHRETFEAGVDRIEQTGLAFDPSTQERVIELEARLASLPVEQEEVIATLRAEKDEEVGRWIGRLEEREQAFAKVEQDLETMQTTIRGTHAREIEELRSLLDTQQGRAEEMERQVAEAHASGALRIAHLEEELTALGRVSEARIEELETQNHLLAAAPSSLSAQREQEQGRMAERAEKRLAEQELIIRGLEASRAESEAEYAQERARLGEELERRGQLLEVREQMLETERAKAKQARAETPAREGGLEQLQGEVRRLQDVRAEMDVLHGNEIARLKRSFRERMAELERSASESAASPDAAAPSAFSGAEGDGGSSDGGEALRAQQLLEREATLALLSRRNEELERQVLELTEEIGTARGIGTEDRAPLEAFGAVAGDPRGEVAPALPGPQALSERHDLEGEERRGEALPIGENGSAASDREGSEPAD
jgi:hypothetical protein